MEENWMTENATRAYCNRCGHETRHEIVAQHEERHEHDEQGCIWSVDEYKIVKCAGCDDIHFIHRSLFSEDIWGDDDDAPWKTFEYPPRLARQLPDWLNELLPPDPMWIDNLDEHRKTQSDEILRNILLECYAALENGSRTLAAMGARTVLERLMLLKIADQGSFKANVAKFIECPSGDCASHLSRLSVVEITD